MSNPTSPPLCRLCRSLNIRMKFSSTTDGNSTSLHITPKQAPSSPLPSDILRQSYVSNKGLWDYKVHTDDELGVQLKSPPLLYYDDVIKVSCRTKKEQSLNCPEDIEARAPSCAFCKFVQKASQIGENPLTDSPSMAAMCKIHFSYTHERDVLVISRLQAYESTHSPCGLKVWHDEIKQMNSSLRLIDVKRICLVEGTVHDRYMALSYVQRVVPMFWTTKEAVASLYTPGVLRTVWDKIPHDCCTRGSFLKSHQGQSVRI